MDHHFRMHVLFLCMKYMHEKRVVQYSSVYGIIQHLCSGSRNYLKAHTHVKNHANAKTHAHVKTYAHAKITLTQT